MEKNIFGVWSSVFIFLQLLFPESTLASSSTVFFFFPAFALCLVATFFFSRGQMLHPLRLLQKSHFSVCKHRVARKYKITEVCLVCSICKSFSFLKESQVLFILHSCGAVAQQVGAVCLCCEGRGFKSQHGTSFEETFSSVV